MKHPNFKWLAIGMIFLASCSSSQKNKSSEHTKADITTAATTVKDLVNNVDSAGKKTAEAEEKKTTEETNAETLTVNLVNDPGRSSDSMAANDFEGAPKVKPVFDVTINGHQIHSSQPIKNIVLKNQQGTRVIEASAVKTAEETMVKRATAAHDSTAENSHVVIDHVEKNKTVKRKGANPLIWIPLIFAAVISLGVLWKYGKLDFIAAWFRRKKKRNPLESVKYNPPKPPLK